jgi:hypothetical protein
MNGLILFGISKISFGATGINVPVKSLKNHDSLAKDYFFPSSDEDLHE